MSQIKTNSTHLDIALRLELVVYEQAMLLVRAELHRDVERVAPRVAAQLRVGTLFEEGYGDYWRLLEEVRLG